MKTLWEESIDISTYAVNARGNAHAPMICYFMQDAASAHAENLDCGFHALLEHNWLWILTALKLKMTTYPKWNTRLRVQTWPTGKQRLYYYRDFRFLDEKDQVFGVGSTQWIMIDLNTRRPVRTELPFEHAFHYADPVFEEPFSKLTIPDLKMESIPRQVHFSDLDINQHVNNVRYLEWILQSMKSEFLSDNELMELQIHFTGEGKLNETLTTHNIPESENVQYHNIVRNDDYKELIRAKTVWKPVDENEKCGISQYIQ